MADIVANAEKIVLGKLFEHPSAIAVANATGKSPTQITFGEILQDILKDYQELSQGQTVKVQVDQASFDNGNITVGLVPNGVEFNVNAFGFPISETLPVQPYTLDNVPGIGNVKISFDTNSVDAVKTT